LEEASKAVQCPKVGRPGYDFGEMEGIVYEIS
jgi:hypothetical protein